MLASLWVRRVRSVLLSGSLCGLWLACGSESQPGTTAAGGAGAGAGPTVAGSTSTAGQLGGAGVAGAAAAGGGNAGVAGAAAGGTAMGGAGGAQAIGGAAGSNVAGGGAAGTGQAGMASAGAPSAGAPGTAGAPGKPPFDVTFYVVSDTHADPPPSSDLQPMARAINAVAKNGNWPAKIGAQDTHFKGGVIGKPRGVVFTGDLTGWGTAPTEQQTFRRFFEAGNSADSIGFPAYLGLGNHDLDSADRPEPLASQYRALQWGWVDSRHKAGNAPVPVTSFDAASHDYSFDLSGVHLFQGHRFPGDKEFGLASGMAFLTADLKKYANDGRPVILFQHYGMDAFGSEARWWTDADRKAYRAALKGYHVSAVIVGHSHAAFNYTWEGLRVFQVNNAKGENGTGNNDGNGSFSIVRVTNTQLDIVTCRWTNDQGGYEFVAPFFSGPADPGAAP